MVRVKKTETPVTTGQQLASIIKACRDIMRKDKGLNGDLDRLPMLTWIMFLKFLDDMEKIREAEAQLNGKPFVPAIEPPYRWRDWAEKSDGITGDDLIAFVNQDEAVRPDGTKGKGLFKYLKSLQGENGGDRRDVIATVFRGTVNRMINGYLLRDVINRINGIHFTSSEEIHTLSHLYESMLKEMRDAAGDSGEFYTPRPVVQFIVAVIDPKIGETILDPACGTGGFLVETFEHLKKQEKTTKDHERIQKGSIFGGEAKPLPYLLAQMNLLLHGLEYPKIDSLNSLRFPLREIGDSDRVDVIVTNPPFGGEEEKGILGNFPEDKQTAETTLLFLQLIMRKLKRGTAGKRGGRCGMVVPNGMLFGDGICARIKEDLLRDFNLHTIVKLPQGVFEPYTPIETNLLFFEHGKSTKEIWYYEVPLPEGRTQYTKTKPMKFEEFAPILVWWKNRQENNQAWKVSIDKIIANNFNLDVKNPSVSTLRDHRDPQEIITNIQNKEKRITELIEEIKKETIKTIFYPSNYHCKKMNDVTKLVKRRVEINPLQKVCSLGVKWWGKGAYVAEEKDASELRAERFLVKANDVIYNDMWARHGSVAIIPKELDGYFVSAHFPTWELDQNIIYPPFLSWCFRSSWFWEACEKNAQGSTGRNAITKQDFRNIVLPVPALDAQKEIVTELNSLQDKIDELMRLQTSLEKDRDALVPAVLAKAFGEGPS
jgi:type I restriction enzyme M protein